LNALDEANREKLMQMLNAVERIEARA